MRYLLGNRETLLVDMIQCWRRSHNLLPLKPFLTFVRTAEFNRSNPEVSTTLSVLLLTNGVQEAAVGSRQDYLPTL